MSELYIKTLPLGMFQTNCYIISNQCTKEAIVFDPADSADRIEQYLKANDLVCSGILLTHGHFDHILAAAKLVEATHAKVYANEEELGILEDANLNVSTQIRKVCTLTPGILLKDQQMIQLAGFSIKVIHTPGHTVGSTCYYIIGHEMLISGDTLFRENIGRTDLPTGNGRLLVESIKEKLMILEDQVAVYPGHGEATTIGYERDNNRYLTENWFD